MTRDVARDLLGSPYDDLTPVQRSVIDLIATEAPADLDDRLKHDDRSRGERRGIAKRQDESLRILREQGTDG